MVVEREKKGRRGRRFSFMLEVVSEMRLRLRFEVVQTALGSFKACSIQVLLLLPRSWGTFPPAW